MTRPRVVMATAAAALTVAAAGCGSSGSGQVNASGTGGSGPTSTSSSAPKAPPVTNPLSMKEFIDHPCNLLTKEQAKALGATEPGEPDNVGDPHSSGPACNWDNTHAVESFSASIIPGDKRGLDDIYRANQTPGYFPHFDPTMVKGYPGVFVGQAGDRRSGICGLVVGVNDHSVLSTDYTGNQDTEHPCAKVKKVAAAVIDTIKGGA